MKIEFGAKQNSPRQVAGQLQDCVQSIRRWSWSSPGGIANRREGNSSGYICDVLGRYPPRTEEVSKRRARNHDGSANESEPRRRQEVEQLSMTTKPKPSGAGYSALVVGRTSTRGTGHPPHFAGAVKIRAGAISRLMTVAFADKTFHPAFATVAISRSCSCRARTTAS